MIFEYLFLVLLILIGALAILWKTVLSMIDGKNLKGFIYFLFLGISLIFLSAFIFYKVSYFFIAFLGYLNVILFALIVFYFIRSNKK